MKDTLHISFTGTASGMNREQHSQLRSEFGRIVREAGNTKRVVLHHGDCIGADEEAHHLALDFGFEVVIHPPDKVAKRAWCEGAIYVRPTAPYLVRNHDIVDAGVRLIACPSQLVEVRRSGTWATVRYARTLGRPVTIIYPRNAGTQGTQGTEANFLEEGSPPTHAADYEFYLKLRRLNEEIHRWEKFYTFVKGIEPIYRSWASFRLYTDGSGFLFAPDGTEQKFMGLDQAIRIVNHEYHKMRVAWKTKGERP